METRTEMPAITFGPDCSDDTLHSILSGWCARIWLPDVVLVALCIGPGPQDGTTSLKVWSKQDNDYTNKAVIQTDAIRKIEIL